VRDGVGGLFCHVSNDVSETDVILARPHSFPSDKLLSYPLFFEQARNERMHLPPAPLFGSGVVSLFSRRMQIPSFCR
jgi:hypothetical protein